MNRASLHPEERKLRSRLLQIFSQAEGFLHGSLIEMSRSCGKPRCRCASDSRFLHRSLYLGASIEGKPTMLYIPKEQEQTARRWAGHFDEASQLLDALNIQGRRRIAEFKEARARARKKAAGNKQKASSKSARKKKQKPKPPSQPPPS